MMYSQMESQEKKHVQKGRDKAISFNFAIIFYWLIPDLIFQLGK